MINIIADFICYRIANRYGLFKSLLQKKLRSQPPQRIKKQFLNTHNKLIFLYSKTKTPCNKTMKHIFKQYIQKHTTSATFNPSKQLLNCFLKSCKYLK